MIKQWKSYKNKKRKSYNIKLDIDNNKIYHLIIQGAYQCEACDMDFSSEQEFEEHRKKEYSRDSTSNS